MALSIAGGDHTPSMRGALLFLAVINLEQQRENVSQGGKEMLEV